MVLIASVPRLCILFVLWDTFFRRHQFCIVVSDTVDSTNGAMVGCRKTFRATTDKIISNDEIIDGAMGRTATSVGD